MNRIVSALCTVALLAWAATATHAAQLAISGPTKAEPGQLVMLAVEGLGPGELADCRLIHWPAEGVTVIPATTWAGQPFVLFNAAEPGTYVLVVFLQNAGGAYVGHGVTVGNPQPGPGPHPGPNPNPGPQRLSLALVIEETSQRTPAQAAVLTSTSLRHYLKAQKVEFRLLDRDQAETAPAEYARYFQAAAEAATYPVLFLVGDDDGVIRKVALPATAEAFQALVEESLVED